MRLASGAEIVTRVHVVSGGRLPVPAPSMLDMKLPCRALLVALAAFVAVVESSKPLPDFVAVCSRSDPHLDACVTESVMALRPHLAKGVPAMHVPSIEPLLLGDMPQLQGAGLVIHGYDIRATECSSFQLSKLSILLSDRVKFRLFFPRLRVTARYSVSGSVMLLPVSGSGPFSGDFTNINADVVLKTRVAGKHIALDGVKIKVSIGGGHVELGNLFNGDPVLGPAANDLVNNNFQMLVGEVLPSVEAALEGKVGAIVRKVFATYTLDRLFPPF